MSFELSHPQYLIGLIFIAVLIWGFRYSLTDFPKSQRYFSLTVRVVILILIVFALSGLTFMSPTHEKMLVFLLDQSRSIDTAANEKAQQFIESAQKIAGKTPIRVVTFAASPQIQPLESLVFPSSDIVQEPIAASELLNTNITNIEAALEPALALIPPRYVPHLVILSDGNETAGDILTAAVRGGVTISTVPLPASAEHEVQLTDIKLPVQVRQGEPFYLDIVIQSNCNTEGTITLYKDSFKVIEETKPLKTGENIFRFQQSVEDQRQQEFSVTVAARDDTILDNNRMARLLFTGGKPRVLIIDTEPKTIRDLVSALREQDIAAEFRPAEGVPKTLEELDHFDAVILSNVPATSLEQHQMELLCIYLRDLGGGLMMLGSEQSFGLGVYYKTPIEEVLPVRCDFEKEKEKPSLAISLVIDRSGSMGGQKMELAKDAAKAAVELLSPRDFITVIAFDHESYVVSAAQSAVSTNTINAAISTIEAAGGTNIYSGLIDAHEQLRRTSAKLKHVILLTDGHSSAGDYEGIVRQMVNDQITVSTVGVGDADNELLKMIAQNGKGRHYSCNDPKAIPQIFAKETITAGKSAINEIPFIPVIVTPTEVLANIDIETAPPLLGYVVTRAKPTSQFILATQNETGTGDPLLVWWRYGLGMSAAFTSDAKSRWGAEWLTWSGYSKFWAQIIRQIMRQSNQRGSRLEIQQYSGGVHLTLDVWDEEKNRYINEATGQTTVIYPNLNKKEIMLQQTAPGHYEADIDLEQTTHQGGYHLQTVLGLGEKNLVNQSRGVMVGYPEELHLKPANNNLLQQIAESTGGLFNPKPEELFQPNSTRTVWRTTPLWSYLLTVA
ncbi:MAG: VWA domain-containing protein, partial [Planctomycetaceae bacterium]|nr:VWA domain-containing protein [Planctomycetaceae bacterium]